MRRGGTLASIEASEFNHLTSLLKSKNVVFSHLMDSTGDSYLEAIYVMNLTASDFGKDGSKCLEFDPKRIKNKSGDKIAAYDRYTTTELDLTANTFKDAIAKTQQNRRGGEARALYRGRVAFLRQVPLAAASLR